MPRQNPQKLKPSNKLREFLKHFEGLALTAYWDEIGRVWTVGYGHTAGAYKGQKITPEKADELLEQDMEHYAGYVRKALGKTQVRQREFDVLVSMCMNLGPGDLLEPSESTLMRELLAGHYDKVPAQIVRWDKGGAPPKPVAGLTRRRYSEQDIWTRNDYTPRPS